MAKKYRERSLLEFQREFSTEEACVQHLREMRWPMDSDVPDVIILKRGLSAREISLIANRVGQKLALQLELYSIKLVRLCSNGIGLSIIWPWPKLVFRYLRCSVFWKSEITKLRG